MSTDPTNPPASQATSQAKTELDKVLAEIEAQFAQKPTGITTPSADSSIGGTSVGDMNNSLAATTNATNPVLKLTPSGGGGAPVPPAQPKPPTPNVSPITTPTPPISTISTPPTAKTPTPPVSSGLGMPMHTATQPVKPEPSTPSITTPAPEINSSKDNSDKKQPKKDASSKPSLIQKLGGAKFVAGLTAIIIAIAGLGTSIVLQQQTADNRSSANWCNAPGGGTNFGNPCEPNGSVNCGGDGVQTICQGNTWHATGGCCGEPVGGGYTPPEATTPPSDGCPAGGICDPPNTCETVGNGSQTGYYCTPTNCGNRWLWNPGVCPITVAPTTNPNPTPESTAGPGTGGTPVTVVPTGQQSCKVQSDKGQKTCQVSAGQNTGFLCECVLPNEYNTGWNCNTRDPVTCGTASGEVYAQVICKQRNVEETTGSNQSCNNTESKVQVTNSGRCISLAEGATGVFASLYQCSGTDLSNYSNGCNTGRTSAPTNNGAYCLADNYCGVQQLDVQWSLDGKSYTSYISSADTVGCQTTTIPNTPVVPPPPPVGTIPEPSPSPQAAPSPSPTPTPAVLACVDITKSPQTPTLGSSVTATCTPVNGATSYKFRTIFQGKAGSPTTTDLATSGTQPNISVPFTVNKAGTYIIQCAVCQGTNCTAWGSTASINSNSGTQ